MRTLSQALQDAYAANVQRPAWLMTVAWPEPVYLSSYGDVSNFQGHFWVATDMDVSKVKIAGTEISGSVSLGNADDLFASATLNHGIAGREILIYGYDAAATATGDILLLARAVGGKATITPDKVVFTVREPVSRMFTPRLFVQPPAFNHLLPAGTVLTINGQTYKIERFSTQAQ